MAVRCPVCGEGFETDEEFTAHEHEIHPGWKGTGAGFQCPTCGASFTQEEDLVAHQGQAHADG
jgi:uncharacterized C2H2 Zn-finger protein